MILSFRVPNRGAHCLDPTPMMTPALQILSRFSQSQSASSTLHRSCLASLLRNVSSFYEPSFRLGTRLTTGEVLHASVNQVHSAQPAIVVGLVDKSASWQTRLKHWIEGTQFAERTDSTPQQWFSVSTVHRKLIQLCLLLWDL